MVTDIKNTSAETAVLGAILLDNNILDNLDLSVQDFYHEANKVTFTAMREIINNGGKCDNVTLGDKLITMGKFDDVGGYRYILQLGSLASMNAKEHAAIVKKNAQLRKIALMADMALSKCKSGGDPDEILAEIQSLNIDSPTKEVQNVFEVYCNNVLDIKDKLINGFSGLLTSFPDFDKLTGGLQKSTLDVLAARPGMGKTAFALNLATNISIMGGHKVLIFSLEMGANELVNRIVSSLKAINGSHIVNPKFMTKEEKIGYNDARHIVYDKPLYIYDSSDVSPTTVRKVLKKHRDTELVIIDYLQLMHSERDYGGNEVQQIGEITKSLKQYAREFKVPILLLSQLNRSVDSRQNKRPVLSDLRSSGTIEQDADIVMFLYREGSYDEAVLDPYKTELIIAKHRAGARDTINLFFREENTTFVSLAEDKENDE